MKSVQHQFFVIEINSSGIPGKLTLCKSFEEAKDFCAKLARQNGTKDETIIENAIFKDKRVPGMFYNNYYKAGAWVISSDNTLDY